MREPVIEIYNLQKNYNGFTAVKEINFTVYKGDVFGFLGPNGAGKSTTIRMLTSLVKPTSGEIKIFGKSIFKDRNEILSKVGAIVEKPDLYNYLSAYKNLWILSKVSGKPADKKKIMQVLEMVGLKDRAHSKVGTFSQGMKQRLGIAQALIHDPELIILDEPTNGLDPLGVVEIRELIRSLSKQHQKTILLSSHILNEVELLANRMVIINKGVVVVEGEVDKLLNSEFVKVTFEILQQQIAMKAINNSAFQSSFRETDGNKIIMEMRKDEIPKLTKILADENVEIVAIIPTRSLEEYFLKLT